jgi:hypothetical protein
MEAIFFRLMYCNTPVAPIQWVHTLPFNATPFLWRIFLSRLSFANTQLFGKKLLPLRGVHGFCNPPVLILTTPGCAQKYKELFSFWAWVPCTSFLYPFFYSIIMEKKGWGTPSPVHQKKEGSKLYYAKLLLLSDLYFKVKKKTDDNSKFIFMI